MQFIKKKIIKNLGISLIIILAIFKLFNTPYNLYSILNWNYEERMEQNYGYCNNESWGFYNLIYKKFNLSKENVMIINDEGHITMEQFFDLKKNNNKDNKYAIILNYKSEDNENILNGKYNFLQNYKVKYRYNNCYLLKIND